MLIHIPLNRSSRRDLDVGPKSRADILHDRSKLFENLMADVANAAYTVAITAGIRDGLTMLSAKVMLVMEADQSYPSKRS